MELARPRLFCTTEDLFTQSFVVPYLIPMLENAGAVVFTPRERDWQKREVIVDNDTDSPGSIYYEDTNRRSRWKKGMGTGFAQLKQVYLDGENPFNDGSVRIAPTTQRKKGRDLCRMDSEHTGNRTLCSLCVLPHTTGKRH